ncbi:MAG: hypothetical protein QMD10_12820 [Desulfitobacteriaceae bacterium]|nr:hypothetical protein [Desulfitobacteriaceae bacterium]
MEFFGKRNPDRFPTEEVWEAHKQRIRQENKAIADLVSVFQKATRLDLDPAADPEWLIKLAAKENI